jgi:hypothetical protein
VARRLRPRRKCPKYGKYAADAFQKLGLLKRTGDNTFVPTSDVPNLEDLVNSAAREAYMRHAGEVEARNVATRYVFKDNPIMQPYQKYPWETEDRSPYLQIVRPPKPLSPYDSYIRALSGQK